MRLSLTDRAVKTMVFDVDGTLYRQTPLRRAMLFRLLAAHAASPVKGWKTLSALRAYRHAQEHLRGDVSGDVAAAQIRLTCERTKLDPAAVTDCVERWMEREPLTLLPRCIQPGLVTFLEACRARGIRMGALSDYPAEAKLEALGIARYFDVVLCAQAPEVGVFKPDPRGLHVALERLGSTPEESFYVGDRADVDAVAAAAAGVACAIVARRRPSHDDDGYLMVDGYGHLHDLLFGDERIDLVA
jgi:HAD superfamily hydrolase (TIGR01509 family)